MKRSRNSAASRNNPYANLVTVPIGERNERQRSSANSRNTTRTNNNSEDGGLKRRKRGGEQNYNKNWLINAIYNSGQQFEYLFFYGHRGRRASPACLSQWYPAGFTVDGQVGFA
jgi:hypothetical protein